MHACIRQIGLISITALALACGSKGDDDNDGDGTSGSGGNGASTTGGSGGSSAGGTAGGSGGAAGTKTYSFDSDEQAWQVMFSSADTGITALDKADVTLAWVDSGGDPGGAIQVDIPYDSKSQYVSIGVLTGAENLSGKTISARIKLVEGLGEAEDLMMNPGGVKLYAKSGMGYVYANGTYNPVLMAGSWMTIRFNLASPDFVDDTNPMGPFDPADIKEVGIQFDTGGMSMTPMPATFLVDNVSW